MPGNQSSERDNRESCNRQFVQGTTGPTQINGLTTGTTYYFVGYLFWATWDSTTTFRVEVWNSTYSTQITAFNVDTSSVGVSMGVSTTGMNGTSRWEHREPTPAMH